MLISLFFAFAQFAFVFLVEIRKSPNDHREYRYVRLENGLPAIFISDPEAEKSAVALAVMAGSFAEPDRFHGLAHYLEHIMFLGTKKFPNIELFFGYVKMHGGRPNAYTADEKTVYHFDIIPQHLEGGMDRLSEFFIEPLFNPNYLEKERRAVDSEYRMHLSNDGYRMHMIMKRLLNPEHPMYRFSIGSLETLPGPNATVMELREAAIDFYNRHYTTDNMVLVVGGPQSIAELNAMAGRTFANIKRSTGNKTHFQPAYDGSSVPLFNIDDLNKLVEVELLSDQQHLELLFPAPNLRKYYKAKPAMYLSKLIANYYPGGLYDHLKRDLGWIDSLSANYDMVNRRDAIYSIAFELTPEGLENVNQIISETFRFLRQIEKSPVELWRFVELRKVNELELQFYEAPTIADTVNGAVDYVTDKYPIEDMVVAGYLYTEFRKSVIKALLARLVPENVLVMVGHRNVYGDHVEPWFNVSYRMEDIAENLLAEWESDGNHGYKYKLPEKNPYISDVDSMLKSDHKYTNITTEPQLVVDQPAIKVWCMNAHPFDEGPKVDFDVILINQNLHKTARNEVMFNVYSTLANDELKRELASANDAGNVFYLEEHWRGFRLHITGYETSVVEKIAQKILKIMRGFKIDPKQFGIAKQIRIQDLENSLLDQPFLRMKADVNTLLVRPGWSNEEQVVELRAVKLADLQEFADAVLFNDQIAAEAFVFGRYDCGASKAYGEILQNGLGLTATELPRFQEHMIRLDAGTAFAFEIRTNHSDHALMACYEPTVPNDTSTAAIMLLGQIYSTDFFADLRTNQQLGYVVQINVLSYVPGIYLFCLGVESAKNDSTNLMQRIMAYVEKVQNDLATSGMNESDLIDYQDSLQMLLLEKPINRVELQSKVWDEIAAGEYRFHRNEDLAAEVAGITAKDLVAFYNDLIDPKSRRLLALKTKSKFETATVFKGFDIVNNYQDLKLRSGVLFYDF